MNEQKGNLQYIDCPLCLNKGHTYEVRNANIVAITCECYKKRRNIEHGLESIEKSGLSKIIEEKTFDRFHTIEPFQKHLKETALQFLEDCQNNWLVVSGQVGSGKTHICVATFAELAKRGNKISYLKWRETMDGLQAFSEKSKNLQAIEHMGSCKVADILYIDDLFKTERGAKPTRIEVEQTFDLIDYRYSNNLTTIISTEWSLDKIILLDEAVGSRIFEKAKKYLLFIEYDPSKNYRTR